MDNQDDRSGARIPLNPAEWDLGRRPGGEGNLAGDRHARRHCSGCRVQSFNNRKDRRGGQERDNKPIHLVLGGTHLLPAKDDQINSIAVSLRDNWSVRYLAPLHCTGEPAFAILKETFGDRYIYAGLGTTVLLGPKVTVKAEAGQPHKTAMDKEDLRSYREAMMRGPLRGLLGGDKRLTRVGQ